MILLIDMDAFFASVEQAHHPQLQGVPVIVCGDPDRRGVVTAASYEARPFGVQAGMPLQQARRLCPHAHYVEGDPEKYVALSLQLLDLYLGVSPDVEPFSVDEAFVGLPRRSLEQAREVAARIQDEIAKRFRLGASIGAGPNKLIAKMASGVQKPRGLTAMDEEGFRSHFWPREVREMWGVGPQLATRMRSLGIQTVGELARAPDPVLEGAFGIIGPQLKQAAWGRDETPLIPYPRGVDVKSMGHEVTLPRDCHDPSALEGTLLRLSDQVGRRLRGEGYRGRTVCVKVRDTAFVTRLRQRSVAGSTADSQRVFELARELWRELWTGEPLRLLGVTVSNLSRESSSAQSELLPDLSRSSSWKAAVDRIRDRHGEASLVPAGSLVHRRISGHVPFGAITPSRTASRRGIEA